MMGVMLLADVGCAYPAPAPNAPFTIEPPQVLYPDLSLNPGTANPNISQSNIQMNICNRNWSTSTIRPPVSYTDGLKLQRRPLYQDTVPDPGKKCVPNSNQTKCYEEDHLISLEVGGHPTDPQNLWPEPYSPMVAGAVVGARPCSISRTANESELELK